jgi:hypothetical protein
VLVAERAHLAFVPVTLLAKCFLEVGALGKLSPRPDEVLSQLTISPLEISRTRRQVGDTDTIPGLFFAQGA